MDVIELDNSESRRQPGTPPQLSLFHKGLSLWVLLSMAIGILLGRYVPQIRIELEKATVAQVSIPIAILLWFIIFPMMLQIDIKSIRNVFKQPLAIVMTVTINYAIQPFTMYGLALLFLKYVFTLSPEKQNEYLIGSILLGCAPCTAMVFVWSRLMNGNSAYTLTQVAINDILMVVLYAPTVKLLAGNANITMPWDTLLYSVGFFVVIPFILGISARVLIERFPLKFKWFERSLLPLLDHLSMVFLLLMVLLLFIAQSTTITGHFIDILIISVPLILQTFLIWGIAYFASIIFKLPYDIAGPSTLIACSNFFEMSVAIAISVYGAESGAALATVVGVLIEVPTMLFLVWVNNKTQNRFGIRDKC